MNESIYIQIPAYRDSELSKTIIDLNKNAANHKRLTIKILWQYGIEEKLDKRIYKKSNVEILPVPCQESKGCNWARSILQQRWQNEKYTLLLDAHHRFVKDWDCKLIEMHQSLIEEGIKKPLLTAYLPSYDPAQDPLGRETTPFKIYPYHRENGLLTRLTSYPIPLWEWLKKPIPAHFVSLHFIFTEGTFNRELPFDPEIYFFGDEVVTSLRAYLQGYNFFHPHQVIGWHSFDRSTRVPHWQDHPNWSALEEKSSEKIRKIYNGTHQYDKHIKKGRSIGDYEAYIAEKLIEDEHYL